MDKILIFRQLKTETELAGHFRLRYETYLRSRLKGFIKPNTTEMDFDEFDSYAKHYGLFLREENTSKLIGGVRVVNRNNKSNHLPLLTYTPNKDRDKVIKCINSISKKGSDIVEPTKLHLHDEYRSLYTVKLIVESSIILYYFSQIKVLGAVLTCVNSQKCFYQRYGFSQIPDTSDSYWSKPDAVGSVLIGTPDAVPSKFHARFKRLADQYDRTGEIVYPYPTREKVNINKPSSSKINTSILTKKENYHAVRVS